MPNRYRPRAFFLTVSFLIPISIGIVSAQTLTKPKPGDLPHRILVLDGSPVHNVGELWSHASNWGQLGSMPGSGLPFSTAPSAEWPGGSKVEYLWVAGPWVGALINGVPAVSTAAYQTEFRPSSSPLDIVYYSQFGAPGGKRIPSPNADDDGDGSLDEDVLDGFDNDLDGSIDEDYAAISDQMLSRRFRDDDPSVIPIYPDHVAQHLAIHSESYQFDDDDFDDFVGFTLTIKNDGDETLEDVYLGVFADGDVGHRDTPGYWGDDGTAFLNDLIVDHGPHGLKTYDFAYWYDFNADFGQAPGFCGIVVLDHPVDPTGVDAPTDVRIVTFQRFAGNASYEDGGDPTNDFERYELMSSEAFDPNADVNQDYRTLLAVGPFAEIAPGETIKFSFALVVTPRNDFVNVERAAVAFHGQWFDLDNDPQTGIDGKEHQEHWYLPTDNPVPIAFTHFAASVVDISTVSIEWQTNADEGIAGYELYRVAGADTEPKQLTTGLIAGEQRQYLDKSVTPGVHYAYFLVAHGTSGSQYRSQAVDVTVPNATLALAQNAPNPFKSTTSIGISLPGRSDVRLTVYDVSGRRVATVASGARDAGEHHFEWNGTDDAGNRVGAGVYFYRLEAGKQTLTRKLVLMR